MKFTKMHGAGNDYIYFDCLQEPIMNPEALSLQLSDRHFSIGGDGIVLICSSEVADVKMRMFNADGSEGKMCGNAIRCVAKYVYDRGLVKKDEIKVETLSGVKPIQVVEAGGKVVQAIVDMGKATGLDSAEIDIQEGKGKILTNYPLEVDGKTWDITTISMGNPHCVVFCSDVRELNLEKIGPAFENHVLFPERINTEFVRVIHPTKLEMRVWERGSGETFACGTGACAAVNAAVENGFCQKGANVTVSLLGGELEISVTEETTYMKGNTVEVFSGDIEIEVKK